MNYKHIKLNIGFGTKYGVVSHMIRPSSCLRDFKVSKYVVQAKTNHSSL
jgi:hypothetical protein